MKLHKAFNIVRGDVVAFIGAGGKTTTLITLGHELTEIGWRVLATTTTRIGRDQLDLMPAYLPVNSPTQEISSLLESHRFVFLHGEMNQDKVRGAEPSQIPTLMDSVDSDVLLIEADGSRGLPMKAPYDHEPVIPPETSLVVSLVSISVLGMPLDDDHVYNARAIDERYGFGIGNRVKSPWVAQVLRDEELMLRGVPDDARVIAMVNQVPDNGYLRGRAKMIAQLALRAREEKRKQKNIKRLDGVAIGSVRGGDPVYEVHRPVAAIVLAAGMSTRMGQPKVLLPWQGDQTIIEHIINQLILAKVDPDHIMVVTGHEGKTVSQKVRKSGVGVVHNPLFATGEMLSSLKCGLAIMPKHIAAAMVVLGDQPRIQPKTINLVMAAYTEGRGNIVAPSFDMRRGHPILIDRKYWREILELPHDGAPREVINAHADDIAYVEVDNDSVLQDVDTPDAYQQERRRAGLDDDA